MKKLIGYSLVIIPCATIFGLSIWNEGPVMLLVYASVALLAAMILGGLYLIYN